MNNSSPLNQNLLALGEDVMGFLNEVQLDHPSAISLASGRPDERFFQLEDSIQELQTFIEYQSIQTGKSKKEITGLLGQYGRTKGIANIIISKFLAKDEGIQVDPSNILMTVGAQEAMAITVTTLCNENDVLIVENPSYIGISAYATITGTQVHPVNVDHEGIDLHLLEESIKQLQQEGKKAKLVYVIPDFQNPTGSYMPLAKRERLLQLAEQYDFYIIEDNAYGNFIYEGTKLPSLKSLDRNKRVIYFGSFSKLLFPGLRVATLVADQEWEIDGKTVKLSDAIAKVKNYFTVNTSSISQAIIGGVLISQGFSLTNFNKPKVAALKEKRDAIVNALEKYFQEDWAKAVTWQTPQGGFFITVNLPFAIGKEELLDCVQNHQIIFCPMAFFDLEDKPNTLVRFAFSNSSLSDLDTAIRRFSEYVASKLTALPKTTVTS